MRWLKRRFRYVRPRRDRGAIAVLTALLLPVVLLGVGALVLDGGSLYAQKAQTQNGADAGALAVANSCAAGACSTTAATSYAPANSNGAQGTTAQVAGGYPCGRSSLTNPLPICPLGDTACPAAPITGNYANVVTTTRSTTTTSTLVPPLLGRALAGSNYQGKSVRSCAQATWGNAGSGVVLSATISYCNWNVDTTLGLVFGPRPPYATWPPPSVLPNTTPLLGGALGIPGNEVVIQLRGMGTACLNGLTGITLPTLPSGLGWLNDPNHDCSQYANVATTTPAGGSVITPGCKSALQYSYDHHTVVYLPVYGDFLLGSYNSYRFRGFAAFVVTGGYLDDGKGTGFVQKSNISGQNYCTEPLLKILYPFTANRGCLYGFFTQGLVPKAGGGGSLPGTSYARLTG